MTTILKWTIAIVLVGVGVWALAGPGRAYWNERNRIQYRTAEVSRGKVVSVVNSTGTIKPVRSVNIGSFVSGPIKELFVDFNSEVVQGQVLATIDPRIYEAARARERAAYATQRANVEQTRAKLQQARNDEKRSLALRAQNKGFISDSEMDQFKFNRMSLEAQLAVGEAMVIQAKANLDTSELNVEYTKIIAPEDGVIIDRKVDPGQTVAATFQTPDLFVVAPDMRKEMLVFASVDETDIGNVVQARVRGLSVRFTVDAYPDDLFEGKIFQIRKNSTTLQNVVTYPVVVSAPNPDLKLLPGMTASISFQVAQSDDTLRIPNAALRFFPQREQVREQDRKLLEGQRDAGTDTAVVSKSADDKAESRRERNRRHVWIEEAGLLRAVEVITGLSDSRFTQIVSGDLVEGQALVTGIKPKQ